MAYIRVSEQSTKMRDVERRMEADEKWRESIGVWGRLKEDLPGYLFTLALLVATSLTIGAMIK